MPKADPAQVRLTPENAQRVKERVADYRQAGLEVSFVSAANELVLIGYSAADAPEPIQNGKSK
jgi:hypothetical protein